MPLPLQQQGTSRHNCMHHQAAGCGFRLRAEAEATIYSGASTTLRQEKEEASKQGHLMSVHDDTETMRSGLGNQAGDEIASVPSELNILSTEKFREQKSKICFRH